MSDDKIRIYGDSRSGNCYKLKLLCAEMDVGYDWHEVDILAGDTHTPEFLAMNANGKIPLLQLPDGRCLADSAGFVPCEWQQRHGRGKTGARSGLLHGEQVGVEFRMFFGNGGQEFVGGRIHGFGGVAFADEVGRFTAQ